MNGFFWADGHLGWAVFAIAVFTGLCALFADLCWRLRKVRISRLAVAMSVGWLIGVGLIIFVFHVATHWSTFMRG